MNKMSQQSSLPANIGTAIKRAIRHLHESDKGSSLADVRKYLATMYQASGGNIPNQVSIKDYLKNAVMKGDLLKLDNGSYKLKEAARRRRRSRSKSRGKRKSGGRSRSRSRKRSGGRRRKRSGSKRRSRSRSGKRRKGGKRRRSRRSKPSAAEDE